MYIQVFQLVLQLILLSLIRITVIQGKKDADFTSPLVPGSRRHFGIIFDIPRGSPERGRLTSFVQNASKIVSKAAIYLDAADGNQVLQAPETIDLFTAIIANNEDRNHLKLLIFVNLNSAEPLVNSDKASGGADFKRRSKKTANKTITSNSIDSYLVADVNDGNPVEDAEAIALTFHVKKTDVTSDHRDHKYGISIDISYCVDNSVLFTWLKYLHTTIDFLLLESSIILEETDCSVDVVLECYLNKMKKCQKKLSQSQYQMEIIFKTGLPPNAALDVASVNLFWRGVNEWAVATNATVFVNEASVIKLIQTSNTNKSHLSSVAKFGNESTTNCVKQENRSVDSYRHSNVSFSSTYFGVWFYPRIKESDDLTSYEEEDLLPFVELISTRFTNIMTLSLNKPEYDAGLSEVHVASAVARYNRKITSDPNNFKSRDTLKVFMKFDLESAQDVHAARFNNTPTPFEVVKGLADEANSIFNGTVPYLLLLVMQYNENKSTNVHNQLDIAQQAIHPKMKTFTGSYKLGVELHINNCDAVGTNTDDVTPVLKRISLAIFFIRVSDKENKFSAEEFYSYCTSIMDMCITKMKNHAPKVQVGFDVGWKDTDHRGVRNATRLTWFWQKMNDWCTQNKIFLVMDTAIEDPAASYKRNMGWWKFVEDRKCYRNTREYTFLEKILEPAQNLSYVDPSGDVVGISELSSDGVVLFNLAEHNVSYDRNQEVNHHQLQKLFSGNYFGVFLNPYVLDVPYSLYSEKDMEFVLEIVRTRFVNLIIPLVNRNFVLLKVSHLYLPRVAARLNLDLFSRVKNMDISDLLESSSKPLNIFITVDDELHAKSEEPLKSSLEEAYKLAAEANSIYPNTVPFLIMNVNATSSNDDISRLETTGLLMKRLNQKIDKGVTSKGGVKLAIAVEPVVCQPQDQFLNSVKHHLVPHVEILFFTIENDKPSARHQGVDTLTKGIFREFEVCKKLLSDQFPELKVGLMSRWADTTEDAIKNPYNILRFWEEMNKYAEKTKTLVILVQAFDQADSLRKGGWWRIVKDREHYMVQEKYQVLYQNGKVSTPGTMLASGVPWSKVVMYVVGSILGVLAVATVIAVFVIRRVRRNTLTAVMYLSESEIKELLEGSKKGKGMKTGDVDANYYKANVLMEGCAYDDSLEIGKGSFVLDETSTLGSGAYGIVCLGKIQKNDVFINVAAKRVKFDGNDGGLCSLRSLMSEIKVLSYIGSHANIASLLGANTEDIIKGVLYAFLELCALGSLEKYIRKLRKSNNQLTDPDYLACNVESEESEDINKMFLRWSVEIASGMEYLASKHVVHADLATRNVLLDSRKTAKICDFGLSRRMYNYQSYVKTQQEPLPWRWMSPESLKCHVFDEKTDVWSFGITLWEIYTLGNVPYAGFSWTLNFVSQLEEGLRLLEPQEKELSKEIVKSLYEIMLRCWDLESKGRPLFKQLKIMLREICFT